MRVYATDADYAAWLGLIPPVPGSAQALRTASLRVDELLISASYPTDTGGYPTEAAHIAALRDATCAQAAYARNLGDAGAGVSAYESAQVLSINLKRSAAAAKPGATTPPSPDAYTILQTAGLVPGEPWVW